MFIVLRSVPFRLCLGRCVCGNRDSEIGHGEICEGFVVDLGRKGCIFKSRNDGAATLAMLRALSVMALGGTARFLVGMRGVD